MQKTIKMTTSRRHLSAVMLLLLSWGVASALADEAHGPPFADSAKILEQVLGKIDKDSRVAVIRFTTDKKEYFRPVAGGLPERIIVPATAVEALDQRPRVLHVQGTFQLVKALQKEPLPLGHVNANIPLESAERMWNKAYWRLGPLFLLDMIGQTEPMLLLGVWPKGAKGVLDGQLFGPLARADVENIPGLAAYLARKPPEKIDRQRAERLLDASNPLLVLLGLLRLKELDVLSPKDFGRAIDALPTAYATATVWDMLDWPLLHGDSRGGVTKELSDFFRAGPPKRQQALLKVVNDVLARSPQLIARMVNLADLQTAARAYRATIAKDPARRDVVRELDALLKLREKK